MLLNLYNMSLTKDCIAANIWGNFLSLCGYCWAGVRKVVSNSKCAHCCHNSRLAPALCGSVGCLLNTVTSGKCFNADLVAHSCVLYIINVKMTLSLWLTKNVAIKTEGGMEVDGDAISFSHTSNFMFSAKAWCLSAKRDAHVPLNIRIHIRKGQYCFSHVQAWVFKTKITPVISVYIGIQRSDDKNREG